MRTDRDYHKEGRFTLSKRRIAGKRREPPKKRKPRRVRGAGAQENTPCHVSGVLPSHGLHRSTIGDGELNCRVRNGTGCTLSSMATDMARGVRLSIWGPCPGRRIVDRSKGPRRPWLWRRRARPISNARLNASPRLHLRPIDLVVYEGPYRKENSSRRWLPA